mmetsp:Transcript_10417/g.19488  ORF Transcript_10417/g.19488 Transcript_10417/m.19488 type:complete len:312 (+) Transcript_10417:115-1050(+)|eukprot:CAMPEP_0176485964 /NCGR_PEP_ID=MMETSP0200_2-20121128/5319_1 /TAXON_ID=947934 /ORGANISM="Chaetoceros sp., Strain GSL56" /LENGTH=311 /DNA_ID=CAMNT_0017882641 /DNA_START=26 /DNA_END=961 /DNA_ORIENTATION=+
MLQQLRVLSSRSKIVITPCAFRSYVSRAHPSASNPAFPIGDALSTVLHGIQERKVLRQQKWEKNAATRVSKGVTDEGPYRNQDETVEIALNLNIDPRKPGQAIRGSLSLPHGTGKKVNVIVFAPDDDADTIEAAKKAGATHVGGSSLIESISRGEMPLTFDRALATPDVMPLLSKIARILGPRGLMPNAKLDTIQPADRIVDAVKAQAAGMVQYRTDKNGIIHAGVGKGSFSPDQLSDNIREFMTVIQSAKPESFGKGKKKGGKKGSSGGSKDAKYILKGYLTSSQGKGSINVDLRTLDPTSSYFMSVPPS